MACAGGGCQTAYAGLIATLAALGIIVIDETTDGIKIEVSEADPNFDDETSIYFNESSDTATQGEDDSSQQKEDQPTKDIYVSDKIKEKDQLEERGWTPDKIKEVIEKGPTGTSVDNTKGKTGEKAEPATVYGESGKYIVVNDKTGEIFQVSNTNDPDWDDDLRIEWD